MYSFQLLYRIGNMLRRVSAADQFLRDFCLATVSIGCFFELFFGERMNDAVMHACQVSAESMYTWFMSASPESVVRDFSFFWGGEEASKRNKARAVEGQECRTGSSSGECVSCQKKSRSCRVCLVDYCFLVFFLRFREARESL